MESLHIDPNTLPFSSYVCWSCPKHLHLGERGVTSSSTPGVAPRHGVCWKKTILCPFSSNVLLLIICWKWHRKRFTYIFFVCIQNTRKTHHIHILEHIQMHPFEFIITLPPSLPRSLSLSPSLSLSVSLPLSLSLSLCIFISYPSQDVIRVYAGLGTFHHNGPSSPPVRIQIQQKWDRWFAGKMKISWK